MSSNGISKNDLIVGEIYETCETWLWSTYVENYILKDGTKYSGPHEYVTVEPGTRMLFRTTIPYEYDNAEPGSELALFYLIDQKISICLRISDTYSWLRIIHIPWELREVLAPKKDKIILKN